MKPEIIIVDENDTIIGHKPRELVEQADIYRVSALWLKNTKGEFLLAQRSMNKKNDPGKWGPAVAGTVEKGETYEQNIIREAIEELGLEGVTFSLGPKLRKIGIHNHFTQWFLLTVDKKISDFRIQEEEVESINWFSVTEFSKLYQDNPNGFLGDMNEYVKLFN